MRVSVFGLGYVGCVTAACLAHDNNYVIGVDVNPLKVSLVASGQSPIIEAGLDDLIAEATSSGRLDATLDSHAAVLDSDVSLICVGTPSNGNGNLKFDYIENVCREIGAALADKPDQHTIVVRSTVLPGTIEERLIPILEQQSGRRAGTDLQVCMNPEFMREGSAVEDYYHPSYIVIGELDERSGDAVQELYRAVEAPVVRVPIKTAEMVKYVSNSFHALKIAFSNEIGNLCKAHGIDGRQVMEVFSQDHRLNISSMYLKPGFAFGGSCLPKDLRALIYRAKERDIESPILSAILDENEKQIQRGIRMVESKGRKRVGVLGLSFKPGTDDVRESPVVTLVETLLGRGYQVSVFDDKVNPEKLIGANKSFLERGLPHIASLMRSSMDEVIDRSDVLVVANGNPAFREVPHRLRSDQVLVDLVGIAKPNGNGHGTYEGIGW
jgi:GDP-mannose 6-dehydrogenase